MVSVPKHMYPESSVYQSGPMGGGQGLATPLRMGSRTEFVHLRDLQERTAPRRLPAGRQAKARKKRVLPEVVIKKDEHCRDGAAPTGSLPTLLFPVR